MKSYVVEGTNPEFEISLQNKSLILEIFVFFRNKSFIHFTQRQYSGCITIRRNVNLITNRIKFQHNSFKLDSQIPPSKVNNNNILI